MSYYSFSGTKWQCCKFQFNLQFFGNFFGGNIEIYNYNCFTSLEMPLFCCHCICYFFCYYQNLFWFLIFYNFFAAILNFCQIFGVPMKIYWNTILFLVIQKGQHKFNEENSIAICPGYIAILTWLFDSVTNHTKRKRDNT